MTNSNQPEQTSGHVAFPTQALDALRGYTQADPEGIMVKVSRQALDEAIAALTAKGEERVAALDKPLTNPSDTHTSIDGEWYCERHPNLLQGHDDCGGAGITAETRLPMAMHIIRMHRQELRERDQQYGFLAEVALSTPTEGDKSAGKVEGFGETRLQAALTAYENAYNITDSHCDGIAAALAATEGAATAGDVARYFASGPEGSFFTDSLDFAEAICRKSSYPDDWTVTDLTTTQQGQEQSCRKEGEA